LKQADFMVGDAVSVRCRSMGLWVTDGLVVEVLMESTEVDGGFAMPAGSVKVTYANEDMAKWIPPAAFGVEVRAQRQWSGPSLEEDGECSTAASEDDTAVERMTTEHAEVVPETTQELGTAFTAERQPDDFRLHDAVCVFSRSKGAWSRDGIVVKVLAESAVVDDGLSMPEGSVRVLYDDCGSAKWVPPAAFGTELKQADFMVGDAVSVRCRSMGLWVTDGLVVEVLTESTEVDGGFTMPAGSVKVTYANGDMAKWVPPEAFSEELQAQRQWSGDVEDVEEASPEASELERASVAAEKAGSFARSFSRLIPTMSFLAAREVPARAGDAEVDGDDDAYIVSGSAGVASGVLGRYRRVGEHNDWPKYRNEHGAIMYFDEHWKMNSKDDTLHWCYEVRGAAADQPPAQSWAAYRFYGDSSCPVPTVARAADVEVLAVSGVVGSGRAVNGRYVEVGVHNDRPKYRNRGGAIVFFDGYWKMNDRDDVLAWRFAVKDGVAAPRPPAGAWAAHWSLGKDQPAAHLRVCGRRGRDC